MNVRIGFKLQISALLGLYSHFVWVHQSISPLTVALKDRVHDITMKQRGAEKLNPAPTGLFRTIQSKLNGAPQDVA
jgi:hypothetical protein